MPTGFGMLSLVPPLLAIILAIITRRAMVSLFVGIWTGAVIYTSNIGVAQTFTWIIASVGKDTFHTKIIVFTLLLGAGIALIWRLGGALALTDFVTKWIDSHRRVGLTAWLLGLIWSFDDYANNAIVGSATKDLADEMNMSREKLAYILDSTAAPVATIGLSSWVAFEIGLIAQQYNQLGIVNETPSAAITFLHSIPFNIYTLLVIVMVGIIAYTQRDFGEMLDAENRAQQTGKITRDGAKPLQSIKEELGSPVVDNAPLRMFVAPVLALVVVVVGGAAMMGYAPNRTVLEMINNTNIATALVWGSFTMVATAITLALTHNIMPLSDAMDSVIDGFGTMLNAISIIVLAWSLGTVTTALGTGAYVTSLATGIVSPQLLPFIIFAVTGFIAFAIGTSWGTMSIMTPIVIPLAWNISGGSSSFIAVIVGAMFSGAIFGDNCSPISDTTILASTFAGSDHIDHVRTQMYYAGTAFIVAAVGYLLYGFADISPLILIPASFVTLASIIYMFSELDSKRKDIDIKPGKTQSSKSRSD